MDTLNSDWIDLPYSAEGHFAAIADVHGMADRLEALHAALDRDLPSDAVIVRLGDLIDRGPHSLRCIDLAMAGVGGRKEIAIAGNHESMALHALLDPDEDTAFGFAWLWCKNGGTTVVKEFDPSLPEGVPDQAGLWRIFGEARIAYLRDMLPHYQSGHVLFAHAGVNPDLDLAAQMAQPVMDMRQVEKFGENHSMRWVRTEWVTYDEPLPGDLFVVYGHTPTRNSMPLITQCQAGIDLGIYRTARGVLCAAEIDHDRMRFHFAGPELDLRLADTKNYGRSSQDLAFSPF